MRVVVDGRGRHGNQPRGEKNGRWNPGQLLSSEGYVKIRVEKGSTNDIGGGYAYEHILVAERMIGRLLEPDEIVHHRNEVRHDNRPENLKVTTNSQHRIEHVKEQRRGTDGRFTRPMESK